MESYGEPLKHVKISIPLSAYETLQEYKKLAGVNPASFIRQVVLEAEPSLKEINRSLEEFNNQKNLVAMNTLSEVLLQSQGKAAGAIAALADAASKKEKEEL